MNLGGEHLLRGAVFVTLALVVCSVIFEIAGYSAPLMFGSILEGGFLGRGAFEKALRWGLPLFVAAAGVALSFRCGFYNIGAQGQFYMGAICAAFAADALLGAPAPVVIGAGFLAGAAGGALWALWPGLLRVRWGADEVVTTLMGNFIAALVLTWATSGPLKDPAGSGQQASSRVLPEIYRISDSHGVSPGIILIVVVVGLVMWVVINRTPFGTLAGLAGRNPVMLEYQGASLWRLGLASFAISGALAGVAGTMELFGPTGRITSWFLPGYGFTAILVALVANYAIVAVAAVSLFFGGLFSASIFLPVLAGLPAAAIEMINAAIALFITARINWRARIFRRWRRTR